MPSVADAPDGIVVMGQVLAPYGVRGWLKIRPFTGDPEALLAHAVWWVRPPRGSAWREMTRLGGRLHSNTVVAELAGVDSREAALALRGADIGVPRTALPPAEEDEIYLSDLCGLEVVNREGVVFGRVIAVQEFGAHPVLRVGPAAGLTGRERLIPFVPAHVDRVDLDARRIEVDWGADF